MAGTESRFALKVHPFGFVAKLRRSELDYTGFTWMLRNTILLMNGQIPDKSSFLMSSHTCKEKSYLETDFQDGDWLVFLGKKVWVVQRSCYC
jgi:tRNA (cytidine/uridine-2'-O-)-methyltransferase